MAKKDALGSYHAKRDLNRSGEPRESRRGRRAARPRFVIQRHDASSLHFDFRLEIGDVLASWSIPKGPSLDPGDKRLAIRTEDHPLDYADFEGSIPEGEYGAGTVIVWDTGTFEYLGDGSAEDGLARGGLTFWLEGDKLRGAFTLVRTRGSSQEQWLLIKKDDEGADRRRKPAKTQPESVLTGRTNEDLE